MFRVLTIFRLFFFISLYVLPPFIFAGVVVEKIYYFVDDEIITKIDFDLSVKKTLKSFDESNLNEQQLSNTVMSNLILNILVKKKAKKEGIFITDAEVKKRVQMVMEQNKIEKLEEFKRILSMQGIEYDEYTDQIKRAILLESYAQQTKGRVEPSSQEIKKYYEKEKNNLFTIKEPIHRVSYLEWILPTDSNLSQKLEAQKKLEEIKKKVIEKGKKISKFTEELSKSERKKINSMTTGWEFLSNINLTPAQIKKISKLQKVSSNFMGEVSEVLPSPKGIAIYQLLEIKKNGYIPYNLAFKEIEQKLAIEKNKKNKKDLIDKLFEEAYIKQNVGFFDIKPKKVK